MTFILMPCLYSYFAASCKSSLKLKKLRIHQPFFDMFKTQSKGEEIVDEGRDKEENE